MNSNRKNLFLFITFCGITLITFGQPYNIGNTSVTYNDPERNNRSIPTEIFYPANSSGTNVPLAEGEFPVIAFGHGFIMAYSAYQYIWEALVPEGYILAFPTTEGSIIPAPSHLNFGLDLRFLINKLKAEGQNSGSLFYNHIADSSAIMGHSMGGGASFLAVENISYVSTMITLAAAETNPSAINAATNVSIPTLVFSGSDDCVTPPPDHQVPMHNSLGSDCKTFISITGGGHCYFADYNFNCSLGELFCNPAASISREVQHSIVLTYLLPYLDFMLKGNQQSWITFNNLLNNPVGITSLHECNIHLLDLKLMLEGPFNGTNMNTELTGLPSFPLSQPYSQSPWFYNGSENVPTVPNDVVDWILVELRDAPDAASAISSTIIATKAGLLKNDGYHYRIDGTSFLCVRYSPIYSLFPVIYHRNHLSILSSTPLTNTDGLFSFDFTSGSNQAYGTDAQKDLGGFYGMIGGDANADGSINELDKADVWESETGVAGYTGSDLNMNGQSNNQDKNDYWYPNTTYVSQVPD
ncbi:MAG: hypothetical protein R2764_10610 [Bacteroidales bacterium]